MAQQEGRTKNWPFPFNARIFYQAIFALELPTGMAESLADLHCGLLALLPRPTFSFLPSHMLLLSKPFILLASSQLGLPSRPH